MYIVALNIRLIVTPGPGLLRLAISNRLMSTLLFTLVLFLHLILGVNFEITR